MSLKGNCCYGIVTAVSFFKSLKVEWLYWHKYKLRSQTDFSLHPLDMYNQKLA
ncbi:hypothetical protein DSM03_11239 [Leeuwenhoekiella aestuarii]|uniref:Uncharacterized protein n=1 Tax=Leeuwenhoekiella aestuarii TaxID=2249426 RepID=A0A4Q0NNS2_9FLAO|nr:hypothetical protein DSM04_11037 [Leeuwenhoekiella aestuarii]RXG12062.1 hypothetical protein DSM03_11239 [Leeuwenhoekiella aestuarii]